MADVLDAEDDFAANVAAYVPVEKMLKVHDKLHLLNYEVDFIKITKLPRIHRLYFAFPTNPGEQYYNFVMLCAWLINKTNQRMEVPHEYDDPNDVIDKILDHIKQLGGRVDFSASKLKPGFGPDVISVLDVLTDRALQGYTLEPVIVPEDLNSTEDGFDDKEINLAQIEEEMALLYEDDWKDDEVVVVPSSALTKPAGEDQKLIESNVSVENWRLELERVLPQLSQPIKMEENFSWRTRTMQMKACMEEIQDVLGQLKKPLQRLNTDVKESVEKVRGRETNLNSHLDGVMSEFVVNNRRLQELREKQRKVTAEVNEKNKTLARLSDEVESARRKLDERGSMMADGAPVAQARKDLALLKKEISDMDVEIGVMEHCILKSMFHEQMTTFEQMK